MYVCKLSVLKVIADEMFSHHYDILIANNIK